jgi:hypothetical protein
MSDFYFLSKPLESLWKFSHFFTLRTFRAAFEAYGRLPAALPLLCTLPQRRRPAAGAADRSPPLKAVPKFDAAPLILANLPPAQIGAFSCRRCNDPTEAAKFQIFPLFPLVGLHTNPASFLRVCQAVLPGDKTVVFFTLISGAGKLPALPAVFHAAVVQAAPSRGTALVSLSSAAAWTVAAQVHRTQAAIQTTQRELLISPLKIFHDYSKFSEHNQRVK